MCLHRTESSSGVVTVQAVRQNAAWPFSDDWLYTQDEEASCPAPLSVHCPSGNVHLHYSAYNCQRLKSDGMWHYVGRAVVPALKMIAVPSPCFTLNIEALWSYKTLGTTHPITESHMPEDLNHKQHCSDKPKSCWKQNMISEYTKLDVAMRSALCTFPSGY
jgi:hypothetical protein